MSIVWYYKINAIHNFARSPEHVVMYLLCAFAELIQTEKSHNRTLKIMQKVGGSRVLFTVDIKNYVCTPVTNCFSTDKMVILVFIY